MKLIRRFTIKAAVVGAVAYLTLILWSATALAQTPAPGARIFKADPRAETRTYHMDDANVDVPYCQFKSSKISKNKPAPLVVSLHGFGAGPQIMCNTTAVDLAEQGGYILVAPMGYSIAGWYGSPVIHLRAAPGATAAPAEPRDHDIEKWSEEDVMTVLAMMRKEFNIDKHRIYLTGHSMGGGWRR